MQLVRPAFAASPRKFGRGRTRELTAPVAPEWKIPDDLRLFAATFVAGFLFVSILIG